jgi:hypothetical protein
VCGSVDDRRELADHHRSSVRASINALPFGSDRGADGVVVWTLLGVGVRGRL